MKLILTAILPVAFLLAGCDSKPGSAAGGGSSSASAGASASPQWYDAWIKDELSAGAKVHSDLELDAGQTTTLEIAASGPSEVGIVVQKGYDVSKAKGKVWIGTPAKPHFAGTSTGTSQTFTPENGSVPLIVENESPVKTRVVIWTKAADPGK